MKPAITLQNVSFSYQDTSVLQDISLEIGDGEFVGIFGPNGGGKTTLLKLILGFLEPKKGHVIVPEKKAISYVPQRLIFDKQFPISVLELVLTGCLHRLPWYGRYKAEDREKALAMIEKVGLKEQAYQPFGSLSGGQVQRALFARALISNPKIMLLDEPTAGVDADAENDIYQLLGELKGNMTILMVTHQLREAVQYVDRVLCVQREITSMNTQEVCEHFALGLYHPTLQEEKP